MQNIAKVIFRYFLEIQIDIPIINLFYKHLNNFVNKK